MPRGNPNPSPETRIGAPRGPKPGTTSETRRLEIKNAEAAMRIRARLLRATEAKLNELDTDAAMKLIEAAMLKLIKDSEDRGLGAPIQAVDHTSTDGSMSPKDVSSAVMDALKAKHGTNPE